ncbi:MAG TPA: NAD(P)-dependent oxidoreductase [Acidimicrobiales bacterium]
MEAVGATEEEIEVATLKGQKILITGPTGQVAKPLARALAADNEVWGVARFKDPATRAAVEADGVHCVAADLSAGDFSAVPDDFNYVLNLAVSKSGDFDYDLAANVEALGLLMSHCRSAQALLHCSSTAVYQANGHHRFAENDPLGDNHRVMMPTYSLAKIAAESMARYVAREFGIPTTIARLNVPYGDNGGWPSYHFDAMLANQPIAVHTDGPSVYNPIHEDDIIRQVPALLEIASIPATVVNWGGNDEVSIEDWCRYMGELTGVEARFVSTDQVLESVTIDTTRMHELVGTTTVEWHDGYRRMLQARYPDALKP